MKVKILIGAAVLLIVAAVWLNFASVANAPGKETDAEDMATSTPSETSTTVEPQGIETAPGIKTYTHTKYHYSFSYPSSWVMEKEGFVADIIPSILSVHEDKAEEPMRFSVTINSSERNIKNSAARTEQVMVAGQSRTAYIFPDGYECQGDPDCSFILVPILRNGLWYEITAANNAKTLTAYREILTSFRFTE